MNISQFNRAVLIAFSLSAIASHSTIALSEKCEARCKEAVKSFSEIGGLCGGDPYYLEVQESYDTGVTSTITGNKILMVAIKFEDSCMFDLQVHLEDNSDCIIDAIKGSGR